MPQKIDEKHKQLLANLEKHDETEFTGKEKEVFAHMKKTGITAVVELAQSVGVSTTTVHKTREKLGMVNKRAKPISSPKPAILPKKKPTTTGIISFDDLLGDLEILQAIKAKYGNNKFNKIIERFL